MNEQIIIDKSNKKLGKKARKKGFIPLRFFKCMYGPALLVNAKTKAVWGYATDLKKG